MAKAAHGKPCSGQQGCQHGCGGQGGGERLREVKQRWKMRGVGDIYNPSPKNS